jgi:hypothetical protein
MKQVIINTLITVGIWAAILLLCTYGTALLVNDTMEGVIQFPPFAIIIGGTSGILSLCIMSRFHTDEEY